MTAILALNKGSAQYKTDQLIIQFKAPIQKETQKLIADKTFGIDEIDDILLKYDLIKVQKIIASRDLRNRLYVLKFKQSTIIEVVVEELKQSVSKIQLDFVEPDFIGKSSGVKKVIPNDTYFSYQWSLNNNGSFSMSPAKAGADLDMEEAWALQTGDTGIIVGVLDSGVKIDHPDFAGRIWKNYAEIAFNGLDDDADGYIDDVNGWNFAYGNNNVMDDEGHGTNVAGIIGAKSNNGLGYSGVDWKCKIMSLKTQDSTGNGYYSAWVSAIYYAVAKGARVLNMSVGGVSVSTAVNNAVSYAIANKLVIAACMMNTNSNTPYYPAKCNGVIAVGATNANDTRCNPFFWSTSSGSNYGSHISVVAPGNYIYGPNHQSNTDYSWYWGGTSQATPHVAGLAALLLAQDSTRTPAQIKSVIESTAKDQVGLATEDTPGWDQYYGYGRINAYKALDYYYTYVNGSIKTPLGYKVKTVNVSFTGTKSIAAPIVLSDSTGSYNQQLIKGYSYTFKASKNNDINKTNGVTTLDIALVQSHILQKSILNSPYKMIAADVNGDGKISTLDIVLMKRLILGLDTAFTNSKTGEKRLWAFVDSSYTIPDTTNPFPYKDSISYSGISLSQTNQSFVGIKLGDVNWDWNAALARSIYAGSKAAIENKSFQETTNRVGDLKRKNKYLKPDKN